MSFPYKNPLNAQLLSSPYSVPRTSVQGTNYSILGIGGWVEVANISDLSLSFSGVGLQQSTGNTIPINFYVGNGTPFNPTYISLNSDNFSSGRRRLGMVAYVQETNKAYQFQIDNYESLWNAATAATNTVVYNLYDTQVKNTTVAGQNFINAWTASTVEGISGVTRANARWRLLITGGTTPTLYTGDDTIQGDRIVTQTGTTLTFSGGTGSTFTILEKLEQGNYSVALGPYSHAEGSETTTGIYGYHSTNINNGIIILDSSYGDVTNEIYTYAILDDSDYDNTYGIDGFKIESVIFNGINTVINLIDTTVTTTEANIGTNLQYSLGADKIIGGHESHSEGRHSQSIGDYSHSEGVQSTAVGTYSHSEGTLSISLGGSSHSEGILTKSIGSASHSEGSDTISSGTSSHAEGYETISKGVSSHAEGYRTVSIGGYSHSEGIGFYSDGLEYVFTESIGLFKYTDTIYPYSFSSLVVFSDVNTIVVNGDYSFLTQPYQVPNFTIKGGPNNDSIALNLYYYTAPTIQSITYDSLADESTFTFFPKLETTYYKYLGTGNVSEGSGSHVEGYSTKSIGFASHAEGSGTTSNGQYSHAEGAFTNSNGTASHSEGRSTRSIGQYSHAEGLSAFTYGMYSHAEGRGTIAEYDYMKVSGWFNLTGTTNSASTLYVIGNGTSNNNRSNLVTFETSGVTIYRNLTVSASTDPVRFVGLTANTLDTNLVSVDSSGVLHTYPLSGVSGSTLTFTNGLTRTNNNVVLGGTLTATTTSLTDGIVRTANTNSTLFEIKNTTPSSYLAYKPMVQFYNWFKGDSGTTSAITSEFQTFRAERHTELLTGRTYDIAPAGVSGLTQYAWDSVHTGLYGSVGFGATTTNGSITYNSGNDLAHSNYSIFGKFDTWPDVTTVTTNVLKTFNGWYGLYGGYLDAYGKSGSTMERFMFYTAGGIRYYNANAYLNVTNIMGLYIAPMKSAFTGITNGWGIYQQGSQDNNYFGGKLGVGTTAITNSLHISASTDPVRFVGVQSSTDTDLLTMDGTGVVHKIATSAITTTAATIYTSDGTLLSNRVVNLSSYTLNFSSTTNPNTLVMSGGNVGIGILSPSYKLDVNGGGYQQTYYTNTGNASFRMGSGYELYNIPHSGGGYEYYFTNNFGLGSAWLFNFGDNTNKVLQISSNNVTANQSVTFNPGWSLTGGTLQTYVTSPNVGFTYLDNAGWNYVIRGASGNTNFILDTLGNVGIGTSSPSNKLTVSASTDPVKFIGLQSASDTNILTVDGTGVVHTSPISGLTTGLTTTNIYNSSGTLQANRSVNLSTRTLYFSSATQPNTLMLSGGNVGIGTTVSSYKLDVGGNSRITYSSNNPTLTLSGSNNGYSNLLLENSNSGNTSGVAIRFLNDLGGSNYVGQIAANGTTNTLGINRFIIETIYSGSSLELSSRGSNVDINTVSPGSGNTKVRVFNNGNVSIGTNPVDASYKLDVSGTTRIQDKLTVSATTDPVKFIGISASTDTDLLTIDGNGVLHKIATSGLSTSATTIYNSDGILSGNRVVNIGTNSLKFSSSTQPNLLVMDGGNQVGIGTSNPTYKLEVVNTGNTNVIRATQNTNITDINTYNAIIGVNNQSTTLNTYSLLSFQHGIGTNATGVARIGSRLISTSGGVGNYAGDMTFQVKNGSVFLEGIYIKNDGLVGLGTTSPTNKLTVTAATDPVKFVGLQSAVDSTVLTVDGTGVLHTFPLASLATGSLYKSSSNTLQTNSGASTFFSSAISSSNFSDGDLLKIDTVVTTTASSTNIIGITYYINTSASITGATQIANYNAATPNIYIPMNRNYWTLSGSFYSRNFAGSSANSQNAANSAIGNVTIPSTFYIIVQVSTTGTDRACLANFQVTKS